MRENIPENEDLILGSGEHRGGPVLLSLVGQPSLPLVCAQEGPVVLFALLLRPGVWGACPTFSSIS